LDKVAIIGGGFSAYIAQLLLSNRALIQIISPSNIDLALGNVSTTLIRRRDSLEINKPLGSTAYSFGSLQVELSRAKLHDRLIYGGNSKIWGGFFDPKQVSPSLLKMLGDAGTHLETLSFSRTGSISNNLSIGQLQDSRREIIDVSKLLRSHSLNEYVTALKPLGGGDIQIQSAYPGFELTAHKVVLAIGPIQLIDLLFRSGYIHNGDQIDLSEYEHNLSLGWRTDPYEFHTSETIIRYRISRAIAHALGIQKNIYSMEPPKKMLQPYIDQYFGHHEHTLKLLIEDGKLIEIPNQSKTSYSFGGSIHYCNMHINGQDINDFLVNISSNLTGIGMAFVKQSIPGPISNDILIDAANKLSAK
jgi:hypothetical protein